MNFLPCICIVRENSSMDCGNRYYSKLGNPKSDGYVVVHPNIVFANHCILCCLIIDHKKCRIMTDVSLLAILAYLFYFMILSSLLYVFLLSKNIVRKYYLILVCTSITRMEFRRSLDPRSDAKCIKQRSRGNGEAKRSLYLLGSSSLA